MRGSIPLGYLSSAPVVNGLGLAGANDDPAWPRYIRTTDIASPTALRDDVFASQPPDIANQARVQAGDLLMTAAGATIGKSTRLGDIGPACFAGFLVRFRPNPRTEGRYIGYWMQSQHYWDQIAVGAVRSTIDNFSASKYRRLRVPMWSLTEQRAIADYLDRETAKIDTLIEKQTTMITRLRERRALVIERVTSPPDRPREQAPLQRGLLRVDQGFSPDTSAGTDDANVWVLKSGASNHGIFREDESKPIPSNTAIPRGIELRQGDLVVSRASGSPALVASAALVGHLDRRVVLSDKNFRLVPAKNASARYLYWVLNSPGVRSRIILSISGAEGLANNIPLSRLRRLLIPLPPLDEQREIADYLDRETAKIDTLIAKVERHIELARERRAALITAAVTGQIDVTTSTQSGDAA
ncbi:restriction endonuclease subunit S [Dermacoccus sp. NHGro5]|uniref:restriction endonuclease subunit S n=1 Tax=Dermacoccus sp. NHGro5 TaxID=2815213 RepID=UPI001AA18FFE|nr:restriction endonuclease subunit S [Dermacoccus sp. NHGro5]MBO1759631.1 restriction endonuclease subunit S [Dermacoccus sp. NHGro5]